jgi:hypothetical protein
VQFRVANCRSGLVKKGLNSNKPIELTGLQTAMKHPIQLRRIGYRDPETGKHYVYLSNNFILTAKTTADIYKAQWQIELFKWIKLNQKIQSFVSTRQNVIAQTVTGCALLGGVSL